MYTLLFTIVSVFYCTITVTIITMKLVLVTINMVSRRSSPDKNIRTWFVLFSSITGEHRSLHQGRDPEKPGGSLPDYLRPGPEEDLRPDGERLLWSLPSLWAVPAAPGLSQSPVWGDGVDVGHGGLKQQLVNLTKQNTFYRICNYWPFLQIKKQKASFLSQRGKKTIWNDAFNVTKVKGCLLKQPCLHNQPTQPQTHFIHSFQNKCGSPRMTSLVKYGDKNLMYRFVQSLTPSTSFE